MSEQWGPWIEYNNEGYLPGVELGMICQLKGLWRGEPFITSACVVSSPIMFSRIVVGEDEEILAFRICKPKGLTILERIASQPQERIEA